MTNPFQDASHLLLPNPEELSYGCVMADFDADGRPEILVVGLHAPNRLFKWEGDQLLDVAPEILQDPDHNGIGVACADMTGNGLLDIYLLNTTAFMGPESDPDRMLINEGGLKFHDLFEESNASNFGAGRSVAWLDPDGSGQYGAYVCNYAEPCRLFVLRNGKLRNIAPELALNQVTGGRSVVAQDFFGSGRMDIFTANENDANRLFRREADGRWVDYANVMGLVDRQGHARGLTALDFDRDGRIDFAWGNWEGTHRLMKQLDSGVFVNVGDPNLLMPSRVRTVIAFDYDNDGWEDLFFNNIGEPNRLFHNEGDGTFREVDPGPLALPDGAGTGATVGDINGDGFLDLFVSHGEMAAMPNALFLNTPNGNHWLRVHAQTPKGAPAIGARVTLYVEGDDRPMIRFIDGGSGYLCQMEPVAHFGLGQATRVREIEIRYTTGRVWKATNLDVDKSISVRPDGDAWQMKVIS